ncbi:MAG: acetyl-CoA carboxylase biotin carboxylase subunit [Geobacteraceae bacterium]
MTQFDSILVANRGEIAVRIIRSAQQQGYRAIAVYSEADAQALHVQMADEAVLIGAAPVKESYLDAKKILDAAAKTGAQAIHPGYGFLSENAEFAHACAAAGIVFIGPAAQSIEIMGNKAAAKRRMLEAQVPCVPGYQGEDQSDEALLAAAREIGVPIMVKAAAGGGGRGMRLVERLDDMPVALASARSESQNAFGSSELILEKAVMQPRHVEIQVFGDSHGHVVHLGERDCSVQRRHQKVVEESPCPVMTPELRAMIGQAAVNAASSINYVGAGTVEFLLDAQGTFYFLEMNTRLQVEHPVTEMVTGQDLVALQFLVAQGYPLPFSQEDVTLTGHAIEVRLYAEDTLNDFLPASGTAVAWVPPAGEGIRVDHGLLAGQEISPFYDPMVAKIIAWGQDRDIARRRLLRALQTTTLFGLKTNREFLMDVLDNQQFAAGKATTAFIGEQFPDGVSSCSPSKNHILVAAVLQHLQGMRDSQQAMPTPVSGLSGWTGLRSIRGHYSYEIDETTTENVYVSQSAPDRFAVDLNGECHTIQRLGSEDDCSIRLVIDDVQCSARFATLGKGEVGIQLGGRAVVLTNVLAFTKGDESVAGSGIVTAPMHGNVLAVMVEVGDRVAVGDVLAVMEAMKMEHRLKAQVEGVVASIYAVVGDQVAAGNVLLEVNEDCA